MPGIPSPGNFPGGNFPTGFSTPVLPPPSQAPPAGAGASSSPAIHGQTAKQADIAGMSTAVSYVSNPPFDSRIRAIPGVAINNVMGSGSGGGSTLLRGRIDSKDTVNGSYRRLNFLYNPSGIQWQGGVETNTIGDASVMDPNDSSTFMMPMSQYVSFNLLFDRTYETWVYDESLETSRLGVIADIKHFYAMVGILGDPTAFLPASNTTGAPMTSGITGASGKALAASLTNNIGDLSTIDDASPSSFMQFVQVTAIFGKHLSYHGVISSATINYTHFTQRMIPNRCSLDITMQLFPVSQADIVAATAAVDAASVLATPGKTWTPLWNTSTGVSGR